MNNSKCKLHRAFDTVRKVIYVSSKASLSSRWIQLGSLKERAMFSPGTPAFSCLRPPPCCRFYDQASPRVRHVRRFPLREAMGLSGSSPADRAQQVKTSPNNHKGKAWDIILTAAMLLAQDNCIFCRIAQGKEANKLLHEVLSQLLTTLCITDMWLVLTWFGRTTTLWRSGTSTQLERSTYLSSAKPTFPASMICKALRLTFRWVRCTCRCTAEFLTLTAICYRCHAACS